MAWMIWPSSASTSFRSSSQRNSSLTAEPLRPSSAASRTVVASRKDPLDRSPSPRESKQARREPLRPHAGELGVFQQVVDALTLGESVASHRDAPEDPGQDIVEVVGDPSGQEAQGFELLVAESLIRHLPFEADVSQDEHRPVERAVVTEQRRRLEGDEAPSCVAALEISRDLATVRGEVAEVSSIERRTAGGSGERARTVRTSRPVASQTGHPVRAAAAGLTRVIFPSESVATIPSTRAARIVRSWSVALVSSFVRSATRRSRCSL